MDASEIRRIAIIGAGRLASHLGMALYRSGLDIVNVYNRNPEAGSRLARRIGAAFTGDLRELDQEADLYILAVSDTVIREISSRLRLDDRLVVHASGTIGIEVLRPVSASVGVFYPVQTFSHKGRVDFRKVPVCVEGNTRSAEIRLAALAGKISQQVYCLDSEKRRILHLGAVFASNFTNFLYAASEKLLSAHDIPFDLLKPLIRQTAENIRHGDPALSQTGPAVRGDLDVLQKHRELLSDHPDLLHIYELISDNIIKNKSLHGKL